MELLLKQIDFDSFAYFQKLQISILLNLPNKSYTNNIFNRKLI